MTSQFDYRVAAYISAIDRIEAANELKNRHYRNVAKYRKYDYPVNLPDDYWALIAESDVLARLANVDLQIGYQAGAHIKERQQVKEKEREKFSDAVNDWYRSRDESEGTTNE